uniref:Endonuclease/exonuclease/phosphatase domain-containing protein n=1 Tax=Noccaea caerulescens TaxID=107243 RepID=A0A1J3DG82_NOCCA
MDVNVQFGAASFFLSCVYGDPTINRRHLLWERVSRIGVGRRDSWCMLGDFNDVLHHGEKIGGPRRRDAYFKPFTEMLSACDMTELPGHGNSFTWGGRRGDFWIQCKLDRVFGNKEWTKQFPVANDRGIRLSQYLSLILQVHRSKVVRVIEHKDQIVHYKV